MVKVSPKVGCYQSWQHVKLSILISAPTILVCKLGDKFEISKKIKNLCLTVVRYKADNQVKHKDTDWQKRLESMHNEGIQQLKYGVHKSHHLI